MPFVKWLWCTSVSAAKSEVVYAKIAFAPFNLEIGHKAQAPTEVVCQTSEITSHFGENMNSIQMTVLAD